MNATAVVIGMVLALGPQLADAAVAARQDVTKPIWNRLPQEEDVARVYPPFDRVEKAGKATLRCAVDGQGRLVACIIADEQPAMFAGTAQSFGRAALRLAPKYQMAPRDGDGKPTRGRFVRVDVVFRVAG